MSDAPQIGQATVGPTTVLIRDGQAVAVVARGRPWSAADGWLTGGGVNNLLVAGRAVGAGDFRFRAVLRITGLAHSAASVVLQGDSHVGFDGGKGGLFLEGPLFGPKPPAPKPVPLAEDQPFTFELERVGRELRIRLDGQEIHRQPYGPREFGTLAFRPWRAAMHIREAVLEGQATDLPPPPLPRFFTIPYLDLAAETDRQVIVDREAGQYLGHPSTTLLRDGRTILVAYPKGHGRGAIVYKRSTDGGRTWSDRLPVPDNWATSLETPTLHRVPKPEGGERLLLFSGLYPIRLATSEDEGATWTPLAPVGDFGGIVAMGDLVVLRDGSLMALFHDDGRFLSRQPAAARVFQVFKTLSRDGGLTWSEPEVVAEHPTAHLCEPGAVRSPDGHQIAVLLRENSRRHNAWVIVSDDEGRTWTPPRELPASLTGDRHVLRYAPDGRLVAVFRDTAHVTPSPGDFVAWVGTYDDIRQGREGQYRVRLLDNRKGADCGYAGLEVLPDGTVVTTTYVHLREDEPPLVASVHFRLDELDARAAALPEQAPVWTGGRDGYHTYRIPALLTTPRGALLAFCEGRRQHSGDAGDIDLLLKRSEDGGRTWGPQQVLWDDDANTCGNPCPVVDAATGTIWLLLTHNLGTDSEPDIVAGRSRGTRTVWVTHSNDDGRSWTPPVEITATTKQADWTWYATGPGVGIQLRHGPHAGRLVIPCDYIERDTRRYYSHVIWSDDHGQTWQLGGRSPADQVNECQVVERGDGHLLLNMRNYDRRQTRRAVCTSTDGGGTWTDQRHDAVLVEPICQAGLIALPAHAGADHPRFLFSNPASATDRCLMTVRVSEDGGLSWPLERVLYPGPAAYSCPAVLPDGTVCCLYERGQRHPYETIVLARFRID